MIRRYQKKKKKSNAPSGLIVKSDSDPQETRLRVGSELNWTVNRVNWFTKASRRDHIAGWEKPYLSSSRASARFVWSHYRSLLTCSFNVTGIIILGSIQPIFCEQPNTKLSRELWL